MSGKEFTTDSRKRIKSINLGFEYIHWEPGRLAFKSPTMNYQNFGNVL